MPTPLDTNITKTSGHKLKLFNKRHLGDILRPHGISNDHIEQVEAVAQVLPFRVNQYVIDHLIDWSNIPQDPIYQLVFPQPEMLSQTNLEKIINLRRDGSPDEILQKEVSRIRADLNPHPAGQQQLNVPSLDDVQLQGIQHKYQQTILFFPREGQTCHSYCSYCFRWAQFIGDRDLKFQSDDAKTLARYLSKHPEVTDTIITGGDPMIMSTKKLSVYLDQLLQCEHIQNIRIGTKSLAWWPQRFVSDADSDELLELFERVVASGKHLTIMAHSSHPRELSTNLAQKAVARIRNTGAVIRCQAPLIRNVNDNADTWHELWNTQLRLGAIPYYMFVERDTGAYDYYSLPLHRALQIFTDAYARSSGLARTVRGPSMSCAPGKVLVEGVATIDNQKVFVLKLIQARDQKLVNKVFFAKYDPKARWITDLQPIASTNHWPWEHPVQDSANLAQPV